MRSVVILSCVLALVQTAVTLPEHPSASSVVPEQLVGTEQDLDYYSDDWEVFGADGDELKSLLKTCKDNLEHCRVRALEEKFRSLLKTCKKGSDDDDHVHDDDDDLMSTTSSLQKRSS